MKNYFLFIMAPLLSGTILLQSCSEKEVSQTLSSPSGKITFTLKSGDKHQLLYDVSFKDADSAETILSNSPLGIRRNDNSFISGLKLDEVSQVNKIDDSFGLKTGKNILVRCSANEKIFTFRNENGAKIQLIVRAFDDGIAFRYCFPEENSTRFTVEEEITGFSFSSEGKAWMQPYDKVTQWSPAYETYYMNGIPIGTPAPSTEGWSFPALFQTKNKWVLLTEALTDTTYFGAHLNQQCGNRTYTIRMPEENEANNIVPQKPSSSLPWLTSWRVAIIGNELQEITGSNIIEELNPPSGISDESWIIPGRASWSWWSDASSPRDFQKLKSFIDFAKEMGWEYSLVDANWDLMQGGNIEELVKYANSRNIGIWMWYNSGGTHNIVTERPRDIMSDPVKRSEEFKKLSQLGVKGVKVDFFQSDKQGIIKQYFGIMKDAADNNIMVNFHGCTIPRGWKRTWPNLISMEAVRGAECYIFDSLFTTMAPIQNTITPFTRNAVGSMDYTPVVISDNTYPHITTYCHELALTIVFESGILHFADKPSAYLSLPAEALNFLKDVPVVWEKSLLLDGAPGSHCVIARLNNNTWYIGGVNGTDKTIDLDIGLQQLGEGAITGLIINDGKGPRNPVAVKTEINAARNLKVSLQPYGGFVAKLNR